MKKTILFLIAVIFYCIAVIAKPGKKNEPVLQPVDVCASNTYQTLR